MRSILAIALGASLGALLRWQLGVRFNTLWAAVPPGTLAANLLGAYIVGVAMATFAQMPGWSPEWRLLLITGFCGGLTTFSTFSAEVVTQLQAGRTAMALLAILVHLGGSLLLTILGVLSVQAWLHR